MAFNHVLVAVLLVVAIAAAFAPAAIVAEEFIVGDKTGWTVGFDYKSWTQDKVFRVGDTLVFMYLPGVHNVYKVNGTDFKTCKPPADAVPLTSGNDKILLATEGRKWYLCGVGQHCLGGQKLFITVLPQSQAPSPPPSQWPSLPKSNFTNAPSALSPWPQSMNSNYSNGVKKIGNIGTMAVALVAGVAATLIF